MRGGKMKKSYPSKIYMEGSVILKKDFRIKNRK